MITVSVKLADDGCIEKLNVVGHSGNIQVQGDPICAAVSVLVRTLFLYVKSQSQIEADFSFPHRGLADLTVISLEESMRVFWKEICDFFLLGIQSIECDFPKNVKVQYLN